MAMSSLLFTSLASKQPSKKAPKPFLPREERYYLKLTLKVWTNRVQTLITTNLITFKTLKKAKQMMFTT